jgi:cell fate (sporulation/competence/biofilm development) regulator YlbF (YheA/YmcA/DUF963 family)
MDLESAAKELGKLISQTPEYKYYNQATKDVEGDDELGELLKGLKELEQKVLEVQKEGKQVNDELKAEYNSFLEKIQGKTRMQSLIATQENYLKLMNKVNEMIAEGIREGAQSRIITDF